MRVLLDECVPRRLRRELEGHDVRTVVEMGWSGAKNGALLRDASHQFDVLLTVDTGIEHQQNVRGLSIAIVVLESQSNEVDALRPLMHQVRELLPRVRPGQLYRINPV